MDQHSTHNNNNGLATFGTILWIIAGISFVLASLFSIGLFQNLSYEGIQTGARLEILILLMGIFNATLISGTIALASSKKKHV